MWVFVIPSHCIVWGDGIGNACTGTYRIEFL